nr:hypothetical protein [Deltaproteobacteria bacterium]
MPSPPSSSGVAAFRPVGRRTRGPATDVVHGIGPDGRPGIAVVYDRRLWGSSALGDDLAAW